MNNLDKYIKGELTKQEMEALSEQLIVSKLDKDKKAAWKAKLSAEHGVEATETPSKSSGINTYWPWLLLVGLLLAAAAYWMTSQTEPEPPIEEQVPLIIASLDIMGDQSSLVRGGNEQDEARVLANAAYAQKDYPAAQQFWLKIDESQRHALDNFYLGLCYLKATDLDAKASIPYLLKSQNMGGPAEEIDWVLSLAYLQTGDTTKAKNLLSKIVENQSYQYQKAQELLDGL